MNQCGNLDQMLLLLLRADGGIDDFPVREKPSAPPTQLSVYLLVYQLSA